MMPLKNYKVIHKGKTIGYVSAHNSTAALQAAMSAYFPQTQLMVIEK